MIELGFSELVEFYAQRKVSCDNLFKYLIRSTIEEVWGFIVAATGPESKRELLCT